LCLQGVPSGFFFPRVDDFFFFFFFFSFRLPSFPPPSPPPSTPDLSLSQFVCVFPRRGARPRKPGENVPDCTVFDVFDAAFRFLMRYCGEPSAGFARCPPSPHKPPAGIFIPPLIAFVPLAKSQPPTRLPASPRRPSVKWGPRGEVRGGGGVPRLRALINNLIFSPRFGFKTLPF